MEGKEQLGAMQVYCLGEGNSTKQRFPSISDRRAGHTLGGYGRTKLPRSVNRGHVTTHVTQMPTLRVSQRLPLSHVLRGLPEL